MAEGQSEIDEIAARRICFVCVRESFLQAEIERLGSQARCFYCEDEGQTISIENLADWVNTVFDKHFQVTSNDPLNYGADYQWYRSGKPSVDAIADAARIGSDAAEDVRSVLADRHYDHETAKLGEECPFEESVHYEKKGVDAAEYLEQWAEFERRLRQEARFFNRGGVEILTKTFDGILEYKTHDGKPAVVDAGPGQPLSALYRARVFQSDDRLKEALKRPDLEIGPPPWRFAPAGRMNAQGVSVFYGAIDVETALTEVRPPVGSRVAVAEFEIIRSIKLLDVRVLQEIFIMGSIFDSAYLPKLERAAFLKRLSEKISRPVMPDDEPFDYLVTQAIADYLATEQNIDGVIYPSPQTNSLHGNVAIFHRAARVESLNFPDGTWFEVRLEAHSEHGVEPSYIVVEEVRVEERETPTKPRQFDYAFDRLIPARSPDLDGRLVTLRISEKPLTIHHIAGVAVKSYPHCVGRFRVRRFSSK